MNFKKNKYRLIIDPPKEGLFNMNKDLELAMKFKDSEVPIFRLYSWNPWCLSLGYNQKDDSILHQKLKDDGFQLIRRPTGGRAVFHANELTYSVVTNVTDRYNKTEIYEDIHKIIAQSLYKLGVEVDFVKTNPDLKNFYRSDERSVSCFASSARFELTHESRKIVGSAQRLFGEVLLQHGSILLDYGFEQIANYVSDDVDKVEKLKNFTLKTATPINSIVDKKVSTNDLASAIETTLSQNNLLA